MLLFRVILPFAFEFLNTLVSYLYTPLAGVYSIWYILNMSLEIYAAYISNCLPTYIFYKSIELASLFIHYSPFEKNESKAIVEPDPVIFVVTLQDRYPPSHD